MSGERHQFGNHRLTAVVSPDGAELQALTAQGPKGARPLLWNGGPVWPRHSPVLFPIVGKLPDDRATLEGAPVHLTQHGFARDRRFTWIERRQDGCTLELIDDARTRALFPRRFVLRLIYAIENDALRVDYVLHNPDPREALPASLGAHPAFAWPQVEGVPREAHRLIFARAEPGALHRIAGGLLRPEGLASPVAGETLMLDDALFAQDALIFLTPSSDSVRLVAPDGTGIAVGWHGFAHLGVWTKPGAHFLCIEPWHGYATPDGFTGDFAAKPGLVHLAPGASFRAGWHVRPVVAG